MWPFVASEHTLLIRPVTFLPMVAYKRNISVHETFFTYFRIKYVRYDIFGISHFFKYNLLACRCGGKAEW